MEDIDLPVSLSGKVLKLGPYLDGNAFPITLSSGEVYTLSAFYRYTS